MKIIKIKKEDPPVYYGKTGILLLNLGTLIVTVGWI